MNQLFLKSFVTISLLLLISSFCFSQYPTLNNSESNIFLDVLKHPENYPRLPNDLTPYVCSNGKVDLQRAVSDIRKGMNPEFVYVINDLDCGDNQ